MLAHCCMIADNDVHSVMQEGMTFTVGTGFAVIFIAELDMSAYTVVMFYISEYTCIS